MRPRWSDCRAIRFGRSTRTKGFRSFCRCSEKRSITLTTCSLTNRLFECFDQTFPIYKKKIKNKNRYVRVQNALRKVMSRYVVRAAENHSHLVQHYTWRVNHVPVIYHFVRCEQSTFVMWFIFTPGFNCAESSGYCVFSSRIIVYYTWVVIFPKTCFEPSSYNCAEMCERVTLKWC